MPWFFFGVFFQVLKLVMSSLASQTPLSDTLLKNESIPNFRIRNGTYREPPLVGEDKNHEGKNFFEAYDLQVL